MYVAKCGPGRRKGTLHSSSASLVFNLKGHGICGSFYKWIFKYFHIATGGQSFSNKRHWISVITKCSLLIKFKNNKQKEGGSRGGSIFSLLI